MRSALERSRGHADFFQWAPNRDVEEWGVANYLRESLIAESAEFFQQPISRGRGSDPPDCEARALDGKRIAIEVTELVDPNSIVAFRHGAPYDWTDWSSERLKMALAERLSAKDQRYPSLQGGPYEQYIVVVHTDELMLPYDSAFALLGGARFSKPSHIDRAFLLISYDPRLERCPYVELRFDA